MAEVLAREVTHGSIVPVYTALVNGLRIAGQGIGCVVAFELILFLARAMSGEPPTLADLEGSAKKVIGGGTRLRIAAGMGVPLLRAWAQEDHLRAEFQRAVTFVAEV